MSWDAAKLGEILTESRIPARNPNVNKRIRVRLKVLGVDKRPIENEKEGATKQFERKAGQFIYGKQNFHKGAFGIIPNELDAFESSADIPSFDLRDDCLAEWVHYYFKIGNRYLELEKLARGVGSKRIHPEQLANIEIPLPSVAEQRRLIELFRSTEARSNTLSTELTHQLDLVKQLRQAFLREAMQGKLVPQDPNDEPASELLKRIKVEKERLVREKKIKKEKDLPPIKEEEIPFEVPKGWVWCRLGEIFLKVTDGTHHSPPNAPKGPIQYVTAKNIKDYGVDLTDITYVTETVHGEIYSRCNPEFGDLLYIKDGATTGIVTINNLDEQFSMLSSVALMKAPKSLSNRYLMFALRSPFFYDATRDDMQGVAITRVTLTKLKNALIPVPPFSEQHRIVAKLEELMHYCDELEQGIKQSQTQNQQLLEQVLREALKQ